MKPEEKKFYIAELVLILEYLHKNGIVHRDIKPENLMLGENGHLRVIDYGSVGFFNIESANQRFLEEIRSKILAYKEMDESCEDTDMYQSVHKQTFVGTGEYVSPEILNGHETCPASDLWALGVIIYRLMVGYLPFQAKNQFFLFDKINSCNFEPIPNVKKMSFLVYFQFFEEGQTVDPATKHIIHSLLTLSPFQRLGGLVLGNFFARNCYILMIFFGGKQGRKTGMKPLKSTNFLLASTGKPFSSKALQAMRFQAQALRT
jgi:serine/threonine protein kinase